MSGPLLQYEDQSGNLQTLGEILSFKPAVRPGRVDCTLGGVDVKVVWHEDEIVRVMAPNQWDAEYLYGAFAMSFWRGY